VHKFSKFIHGGATLLPELVQAVPYWVDDESVRPSMLQSAPAPALEAPPSRSSGAAPARAAKPRRRGGGDDLTHPLLGDAPTLQLLAPRDGGGRDDGGDGPGGGLLGWWFGGRSAPTATAPPMARTTPMRVEPKTFLANERTFLSWLHMAVTVGSIAAALLGFAGSERARGSHAGARASALVEIIALILLPVAVLMVAYSLTVFVWRSKAIQKKQARREEGQTGVGAARAHVPWIPTRPPPLPSLDRLHRRPARPARPRRRRNHGADRDPPRLPDRRGARRGRRRAVAAAAAAAVAAAAAGAGAAALILALDGGVRKGGRAVFIGGGGGGGGRA